MRKKNPISLSTFEDEYIVVGSYYTQTLVVGINIEWLWFAHGIMSILYDNLSSIKHLKESYSTF